MCGQGHGERHHRERRHRGHCCPSEGRVRSFIQPWLFLLLARSPAHGYELMDRLGQTAEAPGTDFGLLYRTLRQFEEDGLVNSTWDTVGAGPARRVYEITGDGLEFLHDWAVNVRRTRRQLDGFLTEYEAHFRGREET